MDYNVGSAGLAGSASDRWSGFGGNNYAYDYSDGFGEITVGKFERFIIFWKLIANNLNYKWSTNWQNVENDLF